MLQPAECNFFTTEPRRPRMACRVTIVLCALVFATTARADDWDDCNTTVIDKIFTGCSAVIAQGIRDKQDIVKAYVARSMAHQARNNNDQALADVEAALKFDPNAVAALLRRANLHRI